MKTRLYSLCLVFAILSSLLTAANASFIPDTTSYNYNDVPICALFNDEDLTKVFHASVAAENDTQVFPHVSYSYTFNEIDETSAEVRFTFSVFSGSQEFPASAFGVIKGTRLPDGDILWEGPLDGTMEIEGDSFDIIVGFAKLNSKNEIQASLTISSNSSSTFSDSYFSFGSNIITEDVHKALQNVACHNEDLSATHPEGEYYSAEVLNNSSYNQISSASARFKSASATGNGQTSKAYFNRSYNTFLIYTTSNCAELAKALESSKVQVSSYVDSFSIGLKVNSTSSNKHSWIAGIQEFDDFGAGAHNSTLMNLFQDALSVIGIPSSTISAAFSSLEGSVSVANYTDHSSVTIELNRSQHANFDQAGPAIVFQMDKNSSTYTGPSSYSMQTSLRYVSFCYNLNNKTINYVYTDTNDIDTAFSATLS